jgi:cytochrome c oxidase assembly protein subunit 15
MLVLYLGNAVLGGISVMVKLAWVSVMGHFLLAMALVAVALVIHRRASEPDGPRHWIVSRPARYLACAAYALTVWVLVLGTLVTAAGPHGGDLEAERLSWKITDLARAHAISVDVLVGVVIVLVVVLISTHAPRAVLSTVSFVLAAMVAQGILGYVQYAQGIPEVLVGFHVAGAVTVFGSVQWLLLSMRAPVTPDAAPGTAPDRRRTEPAVLTG